MSQILVKSEGAFPHLIANPEYRIFFLRHFFDLLRLEILPVALAHHKIERTEDGRDVRDHVAGEELLLGICFLWEAPERAIGSGRRAGKWGLSIASEEI